MENIKIDKDNNIIYEVDNDKADKADKIEPIYPVADKVCKDCGENKTIDNYYLLVSQYYSPYCKKCHNHRRTLDYRKKPKKARVYLWDKLSEETQQLIKDMVKDGKKLPVIAKESGVKYTRLQRFREQKFI